jgi:hypothetical protein
LVFAASAVAVGVKVATELAAFMVTVPGMPDPDIVSLSVKVSSVPAGDESIVVGSISALKVAVTSFPVTILLVVAVSQVLVLVATFVARLAGLAEITVGSVTFAPAVPATPGRTVVELVPGVGVAAGVPSLPPHPAITAASSSGTSHDSGLLKLANPFIFFSLKKPIKNIGIFDRHFINSCHAYRISIQIYPCVGAHR